MWPQSSPVPCPTEIPPPLCSKGLHVNLQDDEALVCTEVHSASALLTLQQIVSGLRLHVRTELLGLLQVLQDKDVGGEVDHVLLPTAKGQTQELVQVVQGGPHHVP